MPSFFLRLRLRGAPLLLVDCAGVCAFFKGGGGSKIWVRSPFSHHARTARGGGAGFWRIRTEHFPLNVRDALPFLYNEFETDPRAFRSQTPWTTAFLKTDWYKLQNKMAVATNYLSGLRSVRKHPELQPLENRLKLNTEQDLSRLFHCKDVKEKVSGRSCWLTNMRKEENWFSSTSCRPF